jgi:hypothetical protein
MESVQRAFEKAEAKLEMPAAGPGVPGR